MVCQKLITQNERSRTQQNRYCARAYHNFIIFFYNEIVAITEFYCKILCILITVMAITSNVT